MEVDGQLKLMALDIACQRLAKQVKSLARAGVTIHPARLDGVDQSVARALAALEKGAATGQSELHQKPPSASLLKKMLRGRDLPEVDPPTLTRSQDTPPGPKHTLALRGYGSCVAIPDLLRFLSTQNKTGIVEIVTATEVYAGEGQDGLILDVDLNRLPPGHRPVHSIV